MIEQKDRKSCVPNDTVDNLLMITFYVREK